MFTFLISVIVVLAVLLVLVILAQDSKGGVGAAFGGNATQLMGVTKTGNILEKSTWVLAIAILVLSLSSAAFYSSVDASKSSSPNIESAKKQVTPSFGGDQQNLLPSTPQPDAGADSVASENK